MIRDALLFSDGSLTVFADGWPMEKIQAEGLDSDRNAPRSEWTKIVRVDIAVCEILLDPTIANPEPTSEIDSLRAENAALRARLEAFNSTDPNQ